MNTQFLRDSYSIVRDKLRELYPNLTDNDVAYISGREEEVFDRAELRTGVKREEIIRTLEQELNLEPAAG